jgi:hypothetical protein
MIALNFRNVEEDPQFRPSCLFVFAFVFMGSQHPAHTYSISDFKPENGSNS